MFVIQRTDGMYYRGADFCKSIVDAVQFTDKSEAEKRTRLRSDLRVVDMPREGSTFHGFESAEFWKR